MTTNNAINLSDAGMTSYDGAGTFHGRTLTAGAGITITNGNGVSGNPIIAATGAGFTWVDQTADLSPMVKETGYFADKAATPCAFTLPTGATMGDTFLIAGFGATGWTLNAGTGQTIEFGNKATTVAGSISSTNQYDQIELVCSPTTTTFVVLRAVGNLTIA